MQAERAPGPQPVWTWRVQHIPKDTTREQLVYSFIEDDGSRIVIESLAPNIYYNVDNNGDLTATISCRTPDGATRTPQVVEEWETTISIDNEFYGFNLLSNPKGPIAAESV